MLVDWQIKFLDEATKQAVNAQQPFPQMLACEAAHESGYGTSELASNDNNLFGMKQHVHPIYKTMNLPTHEGTPGTGDWRETTAEFVKYPDWPSCFTDRISTLERLAPVYPPYKAALATTDPRIYITEVSKTWSTDVTRAKHILAIYDEYMALKALTQ
jgi:flagellum-specific peptidoglycan hydrolase FlgJ